MQISIVGCGWLGQPLAMSLLNEGHTILATSRSELKQQQLNQLGISTKIYQLGDSLSSETMSSVLQSELLILNIPPGGRKIKADFYTDQMTKLIEQAKLTSVKKLLFISTTAVYGELEGEINEQTAVAPLTPSAIAHVTLEQRALAIFGDNACILRLAGLVGHNRHPAHYLAGKTDLDNPLQRVNLVHQSDVITAIKAIIKQPKFTQILHLSAYEHPTRVDYYTNTCKKLGLIPPLFDHTSSSKDGKVINAYWTCKQLNIELAYPNPFDMLE